MEKDINTISSNNNLILKSLIEILEKAKKPLSFQNIFDKLLKKVKFKTSMPSNYSGEIFYLLIANQNFAYICNKKTRSILWTLSKWYSQKQLSEWEFNDFETLDLLTKQDEEDIIKEEKEEKNS